MDFLRNYLFFPDDGLVFDGFFEDSVSAVILSRQKQLVMLLLGGVELFDESRGGDETRHKYRTHSEWHADSKFVGLLKVGYQTSIIENKYYRNQVLKNLSIIQYKN